MSALIFLIIPVILGLARGQLGPEGGGFLGFPDGHSPDGTLTVYQCEGSSMRIDCPDPDATIRVIRANFGRFSIAICNPQGYTDWSVNCIGHQTTEILQKRCDGQRSCQMPVNSHIFGGDPCPGTRKYVEVHYTCHNGKDSPKEGHKVDKLPPWLSQNGAAELWQEHYDEDDEEEEVIDVERHENNVEKGRPQVAPGNRKPILVQPTTTATTPAPVRIPITTPKATPSTSPAPSTMEQNKAFTTEREHVRINNEANEESSPWSIEPPPAGTACPPRISRDLTWNWTSPGQLAIQPCPEGSTGMARWQCAPAIGGGHPDWVGVQPDMENCQSDAVAELEALVRGQDPEEVIVSKLEMLTELDEGARTSLFGGDLESATGVMQGVANRLQYRLQKESMYNAEAHVQQILQNIIRSANNLLTPGHRLVWDDLQESTRLKVLNSLIKAVETHAFVLADLFKRDESITEKTKEITMIVSAMAKKNLGHPKEQHFFGIGNDSISIMVKNMEDGQDDKSDFVKAVFMSFRGLNHIVGPGEIVLNNNNNNKESGNKSYRLNSRVATLTLEDKRLNLVEGGSSNLIRPPVRIRLNRLLHNRHRQDLCAHWSDLTLTWSTSDCRVVGEDEHATVCECDHLSAFGLLTPVESVSGVSDLSSQVSVVKKSARDGFTLEIIICLVVTVCIIVMAFIIFQFRRQLKRCAKTSLCCCTKSTHQIKANESGESDVKKDIYLSSNGNHHVVVNNDPSKMRPSTDTILPQGQPRQPLLPHPSESLWPTRAPSLTAESPTLRLGRDGQQQLSNNNTTNSLLDRLRPRQLPRSSTSNNSSKNIHNFMSGGSRTLVASQPITAGSRPIQPSGDPLSTLPRTTLSRTNNTVDNHYPRVAVMPNHMAVRMMQQQHQQPTTWRRNFDNIYRSPTLSSHTEMSDLPPDSEAMTGGLDGQHVYWEITPNSQGKPSSSVARVGKSPNQFNSRRRFNPQHHADSDEDTTAQDLSDPEEEERLILFQQQHHPSPRRFKSNPGNSNVAFFDMNGKVTNL